MDHRKLETFYYAAYTAAAAKEGEARDEYMITYLYDMYLYHSAR